MYKIILTSFFSKTAINCIGTYQDPLLKTELPSKGDRGRETADTIKYQGGIQVPIKGHGSNGRGQFWLGRGIRLYKKGQPLKKMSR